MQAHKILLSFLILFIIFRPARLLGQNFNINLSSKHERQISTIKSGHKRMMKYYKYYKKDSVHHIKKMDKQAKHKVDSLHKSELRGKKLKGELAKRGITGDKQWAYADSIQGELKILNDILKDSTSNDSTKRTAKDRIKKITSDKINQEIAKGTLPGTRPYQMADGVKKDLKRWWAVMKDSTASDSLKKVAKEKVKTIALEHAMKNPHFQGIYDHYKLNGQKPDWEFLSKQVPGLDTLQGVFESSPEELMAAAERAATTALSKAESFNDFSKQASELEKLKSQVNDLSNPDKLKEQAKEEAEKQALDHFAEQAQKIQAAQGKISKLLGKYREFSNSNDLSDAIKRTSLQGKSFKERIVIGGNFNVISTDPISLDLAPLFGYRFNTLFYMGLAANYRHTFSDSLKYKWYVSPSNSSLRLFANYDVFKNFFAYTEIERAGLKLKANDLTAKKWRTNYFIGLGKKLLIHPKIYMTVTALYNLNNERNNPTYPRKFQIRMGFQTSDLAFRKKKIYYDP